MLRRVDAMDLLRGALDGGALAGGVFGGMYGSALAGGAINTKGDVKKKPAGAKQPKGIVPENEYKGVTVNVYKKTGKGGGHQREQKQLSYAEYANRYKSRMQTNKINEDVLQAEVKKKLAETGHKRLSGRDLLLLKYDVRNKTKYIKRMAKAEGKQINPGDLVNPAFRAQFGGGGTRNAGTFSEEEKQARAEARRSIAGQRMTSVERAAALAALYTQIAGRFSAKRTYKKGPSKPPA